MPIHLTTFPAGACPAALQALDAARPDGVAKEVVARAAALGLVKSPADAGYLCELHDALAPAAAAAAKAGGSVVNAAVKRLVALGAVAAPGDAEAVGALAGAAYDVVHRKPLAVPRPATPALPDLSGLDLLGPEFEALRVVLTRTLAAVRPAAYAEYRRIKDGGAASARADAYEYAFGILARLIGQSGGGGRGTVALLGVTRCHGLGPAVAAANSRRAASPVSSPVRSAAPARRTSPKENFSDGAGIGGRRLGVA